ncbi:MAG: ABC transporter substrate-binding protein [Acidobacteria bacterium]|nr:ABC transporter substrate-binding protein [Acidobacteriota bacterium]
MRIPAGGLFPVLALALGITACGGGSTPSQEKGPAGQASPGQSSSAATPAGNVNLDKNAYPAFPDADAGADPTVPAEQGGKGFTGEGWDTNTTYDLIGDPRAVKGGTLRQAVMTDFPSTLRYYGPNVTAWNGMLHGLVYETLLGLHPTSLDYMPALATHWQISKDKRTFRFRLDPNARFSDLSPVTSEDVIASWKLTIDKTLQDPARTLVFSNFEPPTAESRHIVSVTAKTDNWQNFLYFSGMYVYPASILKTISGEAYVRDYNYKMLPGTGPYVVSEQDVDKGKSIRIRHRPDYWAATHRRNIGIANFDVIQQLVVRDRNLELEMFKKGDLDYYFVQRAQMWVEDLNFENVKRGVNQKRKIFNHKPQGVQGVAMNTRREPLNDVRVRKALRHLFNRESLVEKLMFNEYVLTDSIFPGSVYQNPNTEKIRYDPGKALALLAEAGWKDRDQQGRLTKGGRPLTIEIVYADQASERFFTVFQEDLRKAGITLNLRLTTFETLVKLLDERSFGMASIAYTGSIFPSPEQNWLSRLADEKNTNNITGFKHPRADEIIQAYNKEFDFNKRVLLLREFDGIFTNEHHWILEWSAPYERVIYWNKFGQPPGYISRIGDSRDIPSMWWFDPTKTQKLDAALKDNSVTLGEGPTEDKHWLDYARLEDQRGNAVAK